MRIARFESNGTTCFGLIEGDMITPVAGDLFGDKQPSGPAVPLSSVKLLAPLVLSDADCARIETSFDAVIAASHRVPGAVWSLGKTLVDHALRARAS